MIIQTMTWEGQTKEIASHQKRQGIFFTKFRQNDKYLLNLPGMNVLFISECITFNI